MARSTPISRNVGRLSRSQVAAKRGLFKGEHLCGAGSRWNDVGVSEDHWEVMECRGSMGRDYGQGGCCWDAARDRECTGIEIAVVCGSVDWVTGPDNHGLHQVSA